MKEKITSFYKQPNELNDIIRKLHIVIDFVISSGCATDTKIMDYAINIIKMSNIEESNVNKQISELEVTYLKSLWNLIIFVSNCFELDDLCQRTFYRRLSHSNKERRKGSDHVYLNFS